MIIVFAKNVYGSMQIGNKKTKNTPTKLISQNTFLKCEIIFLISHFILLPLRKNFSFLHVIE